jgi:probable F420-dependent oxidoreductase
VGRPQLTLSINAVVPHLAFDHSHIPDLAADFEAWGADQLVIGEHLLVGPGLEHFGADDVDLMIAWPEPFVVLSAVAARTNRIQLTTGGILGATRPAVVVAKLAASLDAISNGRFRLGLVAGWYDAEFTAINVPFDERFARIDELIQVCRAVWGPQPASFAGRWTQFNDMLFSPVPVHGSQLPIWFGGRGSEATARRVVECDGWIVSEAAPLEEIQRGIVFITERCGLVGRPPDEIGLRATLPRTLDESRRSMDIAPAELCGLAWTSIVDRLALGINDICVPIHSYASNREAAALIVTDLVARLDAEFGEQTTVLSTGASNVRR